MDYQGNFHAAALRTGRSGIIGLLYGSDYGVHTGFAGPLVDGLDVAVREQGADLMVIGPGPDETELDRATRYLKQGKIDALVVPSYLYNMGCNDPRRDGLPVVTALAGEDQAPPHVDVDLRPGTAELLEHLAGHGHRRVLWFGPRGRLEQRCELAAECARQAGVEMDAALPCYGRSARGTDTLDRIIRGHREAFADWLRQNEPPTAVLAATEKVAFGVCRALHGAGLRVPDDVSVAGYDDIRAVLCEPPLTVVSQALVGVGRAAAELALRIAEHPEKTEELLGERIRLASNLVIRESTGPARQARSPTGGIP
jgi:DNA-binding LacI/PurR family transcriptional regulator